MSNVIPFGCRHQHYIIPRNGRAFVFESEAQAESFVLRLLHIQKTVGLEDIDTAVDGVRRLVDSGEVEVCGCERCEQVVIRVVAEEEVRHG